MTEMEHHSTRPLATTGRAAGAVIRWIPVTDDGLLDLNEPG